MKEKIKELIKNGNEIGLHGSYKSAVNKTNLKREKEILESITGQKIEKIRQHWLRYEEKKTPYIHKDLFIYDSTIGWNDRPGFRSCCANLYRPFDHINNKPFQYFIIPQLIMDSHLFDYNSINDIKSLCFTMLKDLKKNKKSHISISWHQRTASSDYKWDEIYREIINHE